MRFQSARARVTANGRPYGVANGIVDVPAATDGASIASDQAAVMMFVGATADRPLYNPAIIGGGAPRMMYDTTLSAPIFSVPGSNPVRWIGIDGSAA